MVTQNNVLPKSRGYDTAEGWIFSDCSIKNFHSHLAKKCKLHDNFTGSSSWKKCPNSTKSLLQIYVNPVFKWYWRCLLLLYTWRQNKCLYYYKWVDLKPFEINHLYVLFTDSAMQTCTTTPRGGFILFTCCHWTPSVMGFRLGSAGLSMTWVSLHTQPRSSCLPGWNHDCANAAHPPQHSLSVAQFWLHMLVTALPRAASDPGTARLCPSGNFRAMFLDVVGAQAMGRQTCIFIFLI